MIEKHGETWVEVAQVGKGDPNFDLYFWQAQTPEVIFQAAWEMVVFAHELKGGDPAELRLQRTPITVQPIRR